MKCAHKPCPDAESLRACGIADCPVRAYIREIVDAAPPLSGEQLDKLRSLLGPAIREWRARRGDSAR